MLTVTSVKIIIPYYSIPKFPELFMPSLPFLLHFALPEGIITTHSVWRFADAWIVSLLCLEPIRRTGKESEPPSIIAPQTETR